MLLGWALGLAQDGTRVCSSSIRQQIFTELVRVSDTVLSTRRHCHQKRESSRKD